MPLSSKKAYRHLNSRVWHRGRQGGEVLNCGLEYVDGASARSIDKLPPNAKLCQSSLCFGKPRS